MKFISKDSPPPKLVAYRQQSNATYCGFRKGKARYRETKEALAREQGFICCYCGKRLLCDANTHIEHLYAKGSPLYEEMQLDYETNLLACCDGGTVLRSQGAIDPSQLYCEAAKGSNVMPVSPLTIECEDKFVYSPNGEVIGCGKDAEVTIKILNLNSPLIRNQRKAAIMSLTEFAVDYMAELHRLKTKNADGEYEEFCFVLESYIKENCISK